MIQDSFLAIRLGAYPERTSKCHSDVQTCREALCALCGCFCILYKSMAFKAMQYSITSFPLQRSGNQAVPALNSFLQGLSITSLPLRAFFAPRAGLWASLSHHENTVCLGHLLLSTLQRYSHISLAFSSLTP